MVGNYREILNSSYYSLLSQPINVRLFFFVCVQDQDEVEFHENTEKEEVDIQPPWSNKQKKNSANIQPT